MPEVTANPFDSLESTYEYVRLLQDALKEALDSIEEDARTARQDGAERRLQALQIVTYKLHSLGEHMRASRRLLNDLRTLRRVLLGEWNPAGADPGVVAVLSADVPGHGQAVGSGLAETRAVVEQ